MASPSVLSGEITKDGAIELLRDIEGKRITGRLRFESSDGKVAGEISLIGGEIAVEQEAGDDGRDPVDVYLELERVKYDVVQQLPALPVSRGTDMEKRGSLAVHVPADLMNYCEQAGLTGLLELSHGDRKAEAFYDAGELLAIELDGSEISDLQEVFGWERGRFKIKLDPAVHDRFSEVPDEAEIGRGETSSYKEKGEKTSQFLRVVEMALTDVMDESERARSPTRTSPPLPPPPQRRPRPQSVPAPPKRARRDPTVRLIYLSGEPAPVPESVTTRRARKGGAEIAHIEAHPERRAPTSEEPEDMAKKRKKKRAPKKKPEREAKASAEEAEAPEEPKAEAKPKRSKAPAEPERPKPEAEAEPEKKGGGRGEAAGPLAGWAGAVVWTLGVIVLSLVILAVLAQLPPVD